MVSMRMSTNATKHTRCQKMGANKRRKPRLLKQRGRYAAIGNKRANPTRKQVPRTEEKYNNGKKKDETRKIIKITTDERNDTKTTPLKIIQLTKTEHVTTAELIQKTNNIH